MWLTPQISRHVAGFQLQLLMNGTLEPAPLRLHVDISSNRHFVHSCFPHSTTLARSTCRPRGKWDSSRPPERRLRSCTNKKEVRACTTVDTSKHGYARRPDSPSSSCMPGYRIFGHPHHGSMCVPGYGMPNNLGLQQYDVMTNTMMEHVAKYTDAYAVLDTESSLS